MSIRKLILELRRTSQEQGGKRLDIQPKCQARASVVHRQRRQPTRLPKPPEESKSKKWKDRETSVLLECMVAGGRFCKGKHGAMDWDLVSKEINRENNNGPTRSKEQCQNRFDTLLKAYKELNAYCVESKKEFLEVTEEKKRKLKLATPLKNEEWYNQLRDISHRRGLAPEANSRKRVKVNCGGDSGIGALPSSSRNPSPRSAAPSSPNGSCESEEPCRKQVAIPGFKTLNEKLRSTLLNLIQSSLMRTWWYWSENTGNLGSVCRMLAIMQGQKPVEVLQHVLELWKLNLVNVTDGDEYLLKEDELWPSDYLMGRKSLEVSAFQVYLKFAMKVLSKNLHLITFRSISRKDLFATKLFPLQQVRVLSLYECYELEHVSLVGFPHLRCLEISWCRKLKVIRGWEVVKELGWVDIYACDIYGDFPDVKCLSSLRELSLRDTPGLAAVPICEFSRCVQLRRLEMSIECMPESPYVKGSKFLEVLSFEGCSDLWIVHGLSGLPALTHLNLSKCECLRRLPKLGCLKALTDLDLSYSGIEEIPGVEELHLLTSLNLCSCLSLKELPFLGHLKALAYFNLRKSGVEEIPGVEDLVSLETLDCRASCLELLPNLQHLPRLRGVYVRKTPWTTSDPSSPFYGIRCLYENRKEEGKVFVDDISDISDTEDIPSDED